MFPGRCLLDAAPRREPTPRRVRSKRTTPGEACCLRQTVAGAGAQTQSCARLSWRPIPRAPLQRLEAKTVHATNILMPDTKCHQSIVGAGPLKRSQHSVAPVTLKSGWACRRWRASGVGRRLRVAHGLSTTLTSENSAHNQTKPGRPK